MAVDLMSVPNRNGFSCNKRMCPLNQGVPNALAAFSMSLACEDLYSLVKSLSIHSLGCLKLRMPFFTTQNGL